MQMKWLGLSLLMVFGTLAPAAGQRANKAMDPSPIGDATGWINADDYPRDAIRANRQGRAVAALQVDATGHVVSCKIEVSSGTESLDAKTCEVLLERAQFNPATDRRGRPIASTYRFPVRWVVPDGDAGEHRPTIDVADANLTVENDITVGADGKIVSCRVTRMELPSSAGTHDVCASVTPGKDFGQIFLNAGKPVAVVVHFTALRRVTLAQPK